MRLELTGRHVEITPTIRKLVDRKLAKLERLLDHRALSAQVVLSQGKRLLRADVTLHARGERFLHGVGEAAVWDAAMGVATEKIEQQAQKLKGKWQARQRPARGRGRAGDADVVAEEAPPARREREPAAVRMPRVLRTMRQVVRSLSVADAARRLDAAEEGVVVFRDEETDGLSVLYRSSGGDLVLVVTAS
jgi:ribosomal subunit interface protein